MHKNEARQALEQRFLHLTRVSLPGYARFEGWPISGEACFERVLLDNACGGVWTDHLSPQRGWREAPDDVLARMVDWGEGLLKDSTPIFELNERSVKWREARVIGDGEAVRIPA